MLVALRIAIGWHFYKEGVKKYKDPSFTSAPFLNQAVGPWAEKYKAVLKDDSVHQFEGLLAQPNEFKQPTIEKVTAKNKFYDEREKHAAEVKKQGEQPEIEIYPEAPYKEWADQIARDWRKATQTFIAEHELTEEQEAQVGDVFYNRKLLLVDYLEDNEQAIVDFQHELWRVEQRESSAATGSLDYHDRRIAQLNSEAMKLGMPIRSDVEALEQGFYRELNEVLTEEQKANYVDEEAPLSRIDRYVTWLTLGVGACLILGLFTRLAALAGAGFLLSVIISQPPWVPGAVDTYYQFAEMFALLTIATTTVGRWGGLDFFIHAALSKCCSNRGE